MKIKTHNNYNNIAMMHTLFESKIEKEIMSLGNNNQSA